MKDWEVSEIKMTAAFKKQVTDNISAFMEPTDVNIARYLFKGYPVAKDVRLIIE